MTTPFDPEALITAMAALLDLEIAPEYRPAVKANLEVAVRMAALVEAVPLGDEAEPAPVYTP
jgi:Protein of unknown function (DUF4089)